VRGFYTLLVVWVVLLTAPATLVVSGVFGHVDTQRNIGGTLALCWILGYLAQFGVFMWIMSKANQEVIWRTILWWLSASLLPWALDWTPPDSLLLWVWYAVAIGLACWIAFAARQTESFRERAVRATGVVLEVLKPMMNVVINNVYIKRKVRLRIERADGAPAYETTWNGLFMLGEIPSPGDRIPVIIDPANPQKVDYDQEKSADTNTASTASAQAAAASATSYRSIDEELERLASLHERGALTDAEFTAAKKKLLR
jgi:putative oligomerization/nucleic acid binding protein